jgi:hypothetical protein
MDDYRFQDYRAMLKGGMDNDILIIGNSRGKSHFDTAVIDSISGHSSFNIGIGGYPLNVQLAKYQLYKEHNVKPRIIVQNIDYSTVSIFQDIRRQHESEQFFPLVYDPDMRRILKELGYSFFELNVPLYRMFGYQQVIKNGLFEAFHLKHYTSRQSYKGFLPENGPWNGSELERMEPKQIVLSKEGKDYLEQFLNQCNKDSVQVILVNSPMFYGAQEKLIGYDEASLYFEQIANQFGIIYLNYTNTPMCRDTSNFCVSVHLNSQAAREFSILLCNDLKTHNAMNYFGGTYCNRKACVRNED